MMTYEQDFTDDNQSQGYLLRSDSNMIEDDGGGDEYLGPVRDDGRGYDTRPSSASGAGYRGRCPISGLAAGADSINSRTVVPESDPQDYGYDTSLYAPGPSGYVIDNAPIHVSPFADREGVSVLGGGGDGGRVYGSEVDRHVAFQMSEEDIDLFVGRDYPFVLRLSKIGSRVIKKHCVQHACLLKGSVELCLP